MACNPDRTYQSLEGLTACPSIRSGCMVHLPTFYDIYRNCTDSCKLITVSFKGVCKILPNIVSSALNTVAIA